MYNHFTTSLRTTTKTIFYADPDVGGGKTFSLGHVLSSPFAGKSIVGIQSIDLAKEIEASLITMGVKVIRIDTDRYPFDERNPSQTCSSIFNGALETGEYRVLIVNQDVALRANPLFSRDYTLYMDEVPNVHERIWLSGIVTSHANVASYLTSMPVAKTDGIRQIIATDKGEAFLKLEVKEEQAKAGKDLYGAIAKISDRDHYDVFAEDKVWSLFRDGIEPSLVLHSIMKPAVFDRFLNVHILGANFTLSLMKLIWSGFYGVEFNVSQKIMENVRYQRLSEHMSEQVLVYFHTKKNCSKYLYNEIEYQPTYDASHDALKRLLAEKGYPDDTKHLVFLNKKPKGMREDLYWLDGDNGVSMSPTARGWDAFKEVDVAVHLAACNENGDTRRVLHSLFGLTKTQVDSATALERAYQAVGRCSIRDADRQTRTERPVILVFFDYRAAKFVADIVGCGEPKFLDTGIAALNQEKKTVTDYNSTAYHKKNVKLIAKLPDYEGFCRRKWMDRFSEKLWDEHHLSWGDWVADSLEFSELPTPRKEDVAMYREGVFKTADSHKVKGNIEMSKVITLDFDDVLDDPRALSAFLAERNVTHLITNSYRSTVDSPRFRLDIPLSKPVNSYGYSHIVSHLLKEIDKVFGDGVFVADKTKKSLTASFHMPSISVFNSRLFIDGSVIRSGKLSTLDVLNYMARSPISDEKPVVLVATQKTASPTSHPITVEGVLSEWSVPSGVGKGSLNFHQAAIDLLFKVGLGRDEAIAVLHQNRFRFGRGEDRNAEYVVDHVLTSRDRKAA